MLVSGGLRCWGYGHYGQLGYGNTESLGGSPETTPDKNGDVPLGAKAVAVDIGANHACAVVTSGGVRCWGAGILGYGNLDYVGNTPGNTPALVGNVPVGDRTVALSMGNDHTCVVLLQGEVRCWGPSDVGELGYGDRQGRGGSPGTTPDQNGDVPVGAPVRTRAEAALRLDVAKARDRRAPYSWRVRGQVTGPFVVDAATCSGEVRLVVKRGKRTLTRLTAAVRDDCGYATTVRVARAKLDKGKKVRLRLSATLPGTTNLAGDRASRTIYAR